MKTTEYTWMTTEELLIVVQGKEGRTSLEVELAQRLAVAVDALSDLTVGAPHGHT